MANNFLNYTNGLTFNDIVNAVNAKLSSDPKFDNFRETAVVQTLIEIFAALTDVNNYYIQRRAEESFFDTAKLRSSIILLSKWLSYSIQRPIPSEAKIKLKLKGNLVDKVEAGDVLQIPIYSKLSYDSLDFLLKTTFQYTFTSQDVTNINSNGSEYEKEIILGDDGSEIYLVQGTKKTKIIEGSTNTQVGQIFQKYKIEDKTFSNRFGSEDYSTTITNVWVGSEQNDNNKYLIDRKSLINWDTIELFLKDDPIKVCLIKTSTDENVEIVFGDAKFAEIGANVQGSYPTTTYDNIYIEYLSTKGLAGNRTGIINEKLNSSLTIYLNGDVSKDITSNVEFYFTSNLVGGADMESIEEIRHNAPNIFYTMDRLVSAKDYEIYLKSLTSPINFKNAIAWGEQEELNGTTKEPIAKLFNVAMFCAIGSMYNLNGSNYSEKTNLEEVVLDLDFDEDGIPYQSYWNLYMKQSVVDQLKYYETSGSYFNLYGDTVTSAIEDIINVYDNMTLSADITSQYYLTTDTTTFETSAISLLDVSDYDGIATELQNTLLGITDTRGTSATNANYNLPAFSGLSVTWDSDNSRFLINGGKNDNCNISSFLDNQFSETLGLNKDSVSISYTDTNKVISTNLTNLIATLKKKSQLTVRNVYVSPIIQKFNLTGNIYVNRLADKEDLHRQIKNDIYSWLDTNADFNVPIYISNITEIVEKYPSVLYTNLKLEPFVPEFPEGQTHFLNTSYDIRIEKSIYSSEKVFIYQTLSQYGYTFLNNYLNETTETTTEYTWEDLAYKKTKTHENINFFLRNLSERTFYVGFVKVVYDALEGTVFRDSQDFIDVISDIHKDMIYIIRYNMLDSNGNIAPEYTTELVNGKLQNVYYRGGYSMKNEIVKLNVDTTCLYG